MIFADFDSFIGKGIIGFAFLCGCLGILLRVYGKHNPDVKQAAKGAVASKAKSLLGKWLK